MAEKRIMWLAAVAVLGLTVRASTAAAETRLASCDVAVAQDAVTRSGRIPGLGDVTGTIMWDGRVQLSLSTPDFEVVKTMTRGGEVEIRISGQGEAPLSIRAGGAEGLIVSKGVSVVRGVSNPAALRELAGGKAATAFREHIGEYERGLISATPIARPDDPHAYGFLVAGAFVASMAGDPSAMGRARDLLTRRLRARLQAVRLQFKDCTTEYEKTLLENDTNRTQCLESANSQESWYERAGQRLLCEAEFMTATLSAEGQFISCSALLPIVK